MTLARWLLGSSCPAGCMLDPMHPMGILAVAPMPVTMLGLGAAPLSPTLLGEMVGLESRERGRQHGVGQAMGVHNWQFAVVVGRAPIWLQQPAGARQ